MMTSVRLPESRQVWKPSVCAKTSIPTKAVDDAGDARQRLVGEFDHRDQAAVGGVFGQVDRRPHPQRQHDEQGEQDDVQGVQDGGQDAVGALEHAGGGGQELPADVGDAPHQHHPDDARHQSHDEDGARPRRRR